MTQISTQQEETRVFVPILLLVSAILAISFVERFRYIETWFSVYSFKVFGLGYAEYLGQDKILAYDLGVPVRFTVSQQCSVALLIAPILVAAAFLVRSSNGSTLRIFTGATISSIALIIANQFRISLIGWCIRILGFHRGFPLGHLVLGTMLSIVAVVTSLLLFIRFAKVATPVREFGP